MSCAESAPPRGTAARPLLSTEEAVALERDWQAAACAPQSHTDPAALDDLDWLPARVPGTAAAALRDAGRWRAGQPSDLDAEDWWFRTSFTATPAAENEEVMLEMDGIATVFEVFLNGVRLLAGESMFALRRVQVAELLKRENELAIRCCALAPLLAQSRKPRARWRQRLVDGNLRFFRTMLLGRAPGFAPGPATVGPWRPIRLVRARTLSIEQARMRAALAGDDGLLEASMLARTLDGAEIQRAELQLCGPSGTHSAPLRLSRRSDGRTLAEGSLRVGAVARWWPHTHGEPALHEVRVRIETATGEAIADAGRVGFRTLSAGATPAHDVLVDGLDLHVNGVRTFARGAVWTPADPVGLAPDPAQLRGRLQRARDAGMNMLRIPGTAHYESPLFHDICDELGLLVWQDFMFANLDYPIADEDFKATVEAEARTQLAQLAGRPSLTVLCGNSEIEQQVAMLGLDPALGRGELFGEMLPRLVAEAQSDAVYVPSAPCGGTLPFRPGEGIANYYGVGGYRRPIEDARRAEVRFAAECLAFSNVPDEAGVRAVLPEDPSAIVVHHPAWKAGVPRDAGADWDFEDVRDHYLKLLLDVDPDELRRVDHERYLELSRAVTGEAMAETFGEWRRAGSPCGGALMLWYADLEPGAGWGVLDHLGLPKPCYHHLRRALAPVAVWTTDEGLSGVRVHIANDGREPIAARLRVAFYRDLEQRIGEGREELTLAPHSICERDTEAMLGHFADASWAYRFGPSAHDAIAVTLERDDPAQDLPRVLSQSFRFPVGRPLRRESAQSLGLHGALRPMDDGVYELTLMSRRLSYGVRIHAGELRPSDDALTLEPGVPRVLTLRGERNTTHQTDPEVALTAINLEGQVRASTE
jgi:beta-mannosidase